MGQEWVRHLLTGGIHFIGTFHLSNSVTLKSLVHVWLGHWVSAEKTGAVSSEFNKSLFNLEGHGQASSPQSLPNCSVIYVFLHNSEQERETLTCRVSKQDGNCPSELLCSLLWQWLLLLARIKSLMAIWSPTFFVLTAFCEKRESQNVFHVTV